MWKWSCRSLEDAGVPSVPRAPLEPSALTLRGPVEKRPDRRGPGAGVVAARRSALAGIDHLKGDCLVRRRLADGFPAGRVAPERDRHHHRALVEQVARNPGGRGIRPGLARLAPARIGVHRAEHRAALLVDQDDAGDEGLLTARHLKLDLDADALTDVERLNRGATIVTHAHRAQLDPV